ncbi:unnamed protein product [Peniophora sp. CBMAI 1063]|nr:unnamed protein product [Peniophora sp. CBMAI 1063]
MDSSTFTSPPTCAPPSALEKRRPSCVRPVFCEPVADTKLFQSASLVQDAMFLAKFFSALKGAARLRLARRDVQVKTETSSPAPVAPQPQHVRAQRPPSPNEQNTPNDQRVPRNLRSEVRDWAQLNPDGPSWHRVYPKATASPPPEMHTIDEDAVLQLPSWSMSFEPQAPVPITGPAIKRRGGMSQLTSLSEEDEEEEEEEETHEKHAEVVRDEAQESSVEEYTLPHLAYSKRSHPQSRPTVQPPASHRLRFSAPRSDFEALLFSRLGQHHSLVQAEKAAHVAAPHVSVGRVY